MPPWKNILRKEKDGNKVERCFSLSLDHDRPVLFVCSHLLQQQIFVVVRLALALNSLYWLLRSMVVFRKFTWLTYFAHWTYALETLYFCLALASALSFYRNGSGKRPWGANDESRRGRGGNGSKGRRGCEYSYGMDGRPQKQPALRLQWALLYVVADSSLIITVVYWTLFMFGGRADKLNVTENLQIRFFNSIFLILDLLLGAVPFLWEHIVLSYAYATAYLLFNILYCLAGGVREDHLIHLLDWGVSPWLAAFQTLVVATVLLPAAHSLNVLVARARLRFHREHPDWGWQDEEELELAMKMSGLRDDSVWAPLNSSQGSDLYSEEEEMGGSSVFRDS